ncbi:outer membrane beta-barrel protein [Gemmatimonadota bacterium]
MKRLVGLLVVFSMFAVLTAEDGYSQDRARSGFYLRFDLGGGYGSLSTDVENVDLKFSGGAGLASLSLGGFLSEDLVLFGEFFGSSLVNPTFEVGGTEFDTNDVTVTLSGFGAGIAYYLSDNWFLQGTLMATQLEADVDGDKSETDFGFGFKGVVGAAWPVSNKVALGGSFQIFYASMDDSDFSDITWSSFGAGLEFTFIWIPGGNMKGTSN